MSNNNAIGTGSLILTPIADRMLSGLDDAGKKATQKTQAINGKLAAGGGGKGSGGGGGGGGGLGGVGGAKLAGGAAARDGVGEAIGMSGRLWEKVKAIGEAVESRWWFRGPRRCSWPR